MTNHSQKMIETLPILAFLGYLLYSCLICALLSGDARLLKIWFVAAPALIAAALALRSVLSRREVQ
ncbi:MAG: hypothetical protein NDI60_10285 [Elusimicrobiales bacterium]|nr:hypothetical protein [Elusimicrobiales bacterium]